jgi:hypothetical protein
MRFYLVQVDISEAATGYAYPIVTHVFRGKTKEEAWGYHNAHLAGDAFLRDCEEKLIFRGQVKCRAVVTEGWQER